MSEIVGLDDGKLLRSDYVYDTTQGKKQSEINTELAQNIQELSSSVTELNAKFYRQTFNFTVNATSTSSAIYVGAISIPIDNTLVSVSFEYVHTGGNWGCSDLHYGDAWTISSGTIRGYNVYIHVTTTGNYSIIAYVLSIKS